MDARLVSVNGVKKIQINGEVFEPIAFRSFWPAAHTTRRFHETGMRLMTVFPTGILCSLKVPYSQFGEVWVGEGAYDWQALRKQMDQFVQNAPDAYFALMLQLDTRDWFLKDHPEAGDSFFQIANAAGWDLWREQASQYIRDMLDYLDREYPEKIYSVFVCAGSTCEWINRMPVTYQNPVKKRAFAAWTGGRETPSDEALERASHGMFRDPAQDQAALDYWRFHNEIVADAICHFAKVVKEHSARRLLVGCFYGYVQYCAGGPTASGHQAAHRVFACPDVDMIFSPATYVHRGLESTSGEQLPADSVILNGKLYFCEIDNTAFPANGNPYAQVLQTYAHRRHKSLEETIHYSRREAALTLSRGVAYWWFDMFGGWYDDDRLMAALQKIRQATGRVYAGPVRPVAEVAVLLDGIVAVGDAEFHRASSEWQRHGHHNDPAYANVILHVVFRDDYPPLPGVETLIADEGEALSLPLPGEEPVPEELEELQHYALLRLLRKSSEAQKLYKALGLHGGLDAFVSAFIDNYSRKRRRPAHSGEELASLAESFSRSAIHGELERIISANGHDDAEGGNRARAELAIPDIMQGMMKARIAGEGAQLRRELIINAVLPMALCLAGEEARINLFLWFWSTPAPSKYGILSRRYPSMPQNFVWQQQGMLEYMKEHGRKVNIMKDAVAEYGFGEVLSFYRLGRAPFREEEE